MNLRKKRGLSEVVVTLIVLVLVLVAIMIVWAVVRNLIQENSEEIDIGKFTVDLEIISAKKTDTSIDTFVKRNPGAGNLAGIRLIYYNSSGGNIYKEFKEDDNGNLDELGSATFNLFFTDTGSFNPLNIIKVEVYPIYKVSDKEQLGNLESSKYIEGYTPVGGDTTAPELISLSVLSSSGIEIVSCEGLDYKDCDSILQTCEEGVTLYVNLEAEDLDTGIESYKIVIENLVEGQVTPTEQICEEADLGALYSIDTYTSSEKTCEFFIPCGLGEFKVLIEKIQDVAGNSFNKNPVTYLYSA